MKNFIIIFIIIFFCFSCTSINKSLVSLSEQDLINAESTRVISKNLLLTWPINSGFIKGSLGSRINQLPSEAIKAIEELDKLSQQKEWNDFDLGYSLGVRVSLLSVLVMNALKLYAPEILKYIPLVF